MTGEQRIERVGGETVFAGVTFAVSVDRFRRGWPGGGDEVQREIVRRPAAAAVVAYDDAHVWLVRQPREALEAFTLELPAGKLDVDGEGPLATAKRELAEEIGVRAERWQLVISFHASSGYSDEVVHLHAATELRPSDVEPIAGERIEVVRWPLDDLAGAIAASRDAKTIIGLQWLAAQRAAA